jgi:phosphoserine phosphatase RsbU/P
MINNEMSVLVVDDAAVNVILLESILAKTGYTVYTADNGPSGRKIALEKKPGIILLDVMMPDEDGFETCRKLKQNALTADIPVIFISAMNDSESIVKGLTVGGLDYIRKPFNREEVLARVKNYLKLHHSYQRVIEEQANRLRQIQHAQQSILVHPENLPEANFGIVYQPILEAGGDFYDVFKLNDHVFGYFVADISGHDLGASYATSALKALIRQNSSLLYTPDETIRIVNSILLSIFSDGQHLTGVYLCLDKKEALLHIVNAAHLPILFLEANGKYKWLEADGDVLGAFDTAHFACQSINISSGDRFFVYSDGLLESFEPNPRSREQGKKELVEFALKTRNFEIQKATEDIVQQMVTEKHVAEDDVVLLGVDI